MIVDAPCSMSASADKIGAASSEKTPKRHQIRIDAVLHTRSFVHTTSISDASREIPTCSPCEPGTGYGNCA
jgi:hypothetical protein